MDIVNVFRNRKRKTKLPSDLDLPNLDNEKYWFLRTMPKKVWNTGRLVKSSKPRFTIDTTDAIGPTMYGRDYSAMQSRPMQFGKNGLENVWRGVSNKHDILSHMTGEADTAKVLSLLDQGVTTERLLGKEWDNGLSRAVLQGIQRATGDIDGYFSATDVVKRGYLAGNEGRLTVRDAINFMQLERIVKDPSVIEHLVTREEAERRGYVFDKRNMPISVFATDRDEALYDVAVLRGNDRNIPTYTINDINNKLLRSLDEKSLGDFVTKLESATKTKVMLTNRVEERTIAKTENKLFSVIKKTKNVVAKKFGLGESAINGGMKFYVSQKGNMAENAYLVVREMVEESLRPLIRETERACILSTDEIPENEILFNIMRMTRSNQRPDNLPSYKQFKAVEDIVVRAASSIIASQVVKMGDLDEDTYTTLSELYKVDAMRALSKVDMAEKNTWMMPLIADYVGMTLPKFAKDMNVDIAKYADNNNVAGATDLAQAVFGKSKFDATSGVLTRKKDEAKVDLDVFDARVTGTPKVVNVRELANRINKQNLANARVELEKSAEKLYDVIDDLDKTVIDLGNLESYNADSQELVNKGFVTYHAVKQALDEYEAMASIYQDKHKKLLGDIDENMPISLPFNKVYVQADVDALRMANADINGKDSKLRAANLYKSYMDVLNVGFSEIRSGLAKYNLDNVEESELFSTIDRLESQGKDVAVLSQIKADLEDAIGSYERISEWADKRNYTIEQWMDYVGYTGKSAEELTVEQMSELWKGFLDTVEAEESNQAFVNEMYEWRDEIASKCDIVTEIQGKYREVRKNLLVNGKLTVEQMQDCESMIQQLSSGVEDFADTLDRFEMIKTNVPSNIKKSENWQETVLVQEQLTKFIMDTLNKEVELCKAELDFVEALGTQEEDALRAVYANNFATYIKYSKNAESMMPELWTSAGETEIFRSIYQNGKNVNEDDLSNVAEQWVNMFGDLQTFQIEEGKPQEEENKQQNTNKPLTQKELSELKYKLRAGLISRREYYNAIRQSKAEDEPKAEEEMSVNEQETEKPQEEAKNSVVANIREAVRSADVLKQLVEKNSAKVVEESKPQNANKPLTQKELSELKYKLRAGLISRREYYNAIRQSKAEDEPKVEEEMSVNEQETEKPQEEAENSVVANIREAVRSADVLKRLVERKSQKAVEQAVVQQIQVVEAPKQSNAVSAEKKVTECEKEKLELGYVLAGDKKIFSVAKYNEELKEIFKVLESANLPDFVNGGRLLQKHKKYVSYKNAVQNDAFDNEILQRAHKTIAKALEKEYNGIVRQTAKDIETDNVDLDDVSNESTEQDVCANIMNHFKVRGKSTAKMKAKGVESNPRFVAQLNASESLEYTAEQIKLAVIEFCNDNWEVLKDYSASTVYRLYEKSVGSKNLSDSIRNVVVKPMVSTVYEESRQF